MTTVEKLDFTCHVCGRKYACDVVLSTNTFFGPPARLPPPACPDCGTPAHTSVRYQPGMMLDLLILMVGNDAIPDEAVERLIGWSTSEDDIERWRKGYAKTRWPKLFQESLKRSRYWIDSKLAGIRSAEPFLDFNSLRHDIDRLDDPTDAGLRLLAIRFTPYAPPSELNVELLAMMQADPQIRLDAEAVIARQWEVTSGLYARLIEAMDKDLPGKVEVLFETARSEFSRRVREARARIGR